MLTSESCKIVRFGPYEADFEQGVLRKHGLPVKIQRKPLAALAILIENAGKTVSREELRRALWPDDTFVDFDKNLSTAINKLRDILCDSAAEALYIETLPTKGYRFRAAVEFVEVPERKQDTVQAGAESEAPVKGRSWKWGAKTALAAAAVVTTACLGVFWYLGHHRNVSKGRQTVVLADFENSTGDAVFDDTLKTALSVSLRQSPFLDVLPDSQVASTLKLMAVSQNTRINGTIARDLCLRTGSQAYIAGAIGSLGSKYVLELKAVSCGDGASLTQEQVTAASRDRVVEALGQAAIKLRSELGESLATVQRFDVPLEQATTSSLEALKAYTLAQKTARENGAAQSLPYAQRAIALDPNFAMAYEAAGVHYFNLAEPARAGEYLTKAFQLRDHASERERLKIVAAYYSSVTGELAKAATTYQAQIAEYPGTIAAYNNLGIVFAEQGQYQKAAEITRQGIQLEPTEVTLHENLVGYLLALQNFEEAKKIIREQQPHKPDNYIFPAALYAMSFLASDTRGMAQQQEWFAGKPEYESFGLALASDSEAYAGHLEKARELTRKAVDSAVRSDKKESGAIWQATAAQREAVFGNPTGAERLASEALKLAPASQGAGIEAALAFALARDERKARQLAQELTTRFPLDTQIQSLWLPALQAQLELNHKNAVSALKILEAATPPLELGSITFAANASGSCLYPTYLRGEASLAAGQGRAAAAEFQKILDHSGIVWNCWTGSMARLGLARSNALQAKTSKGVDADAARVRAITEYKDYLALWKNADRNVAVVQQAQAEYAKLQ